MVDRTVSNIGIVNRSSMIDNMHALAAGAESVINHASTPMLSADL
jgi:hypothetical protein